MGAEFHLLGKPVIRYRTFQNSDPPALAAIWRSAADDAGLGQPMSAELFDALVLSKPYFDRAGLFVALADDLPVGFAHAGFGPSDNRQDLCRDTGVVAMAVARPAHRRQGIGRRLLEHCEEFLLSRGTRTIYAGGITPFAPFYWGMYGGSEPPGVLIESTAALALCESAGYQRVDQTRRMLCDLRQFRPIVNRDQLQVRRNWNFHMLLDPVSRNWWEACTLGIFNRARFELAPKSGGASRAEVTIWRKTPSPGGQACGRSA